MIAWTVLSPGLESRSSTTLSLAGRATAKLAEKRARMEKMRLVFMLMV